MVLKGHFDGEKILLDEPPPEGLTPNTPVEIRVVDTSEEDVFDRIERMAMEGGFPPDYAAQHEHYTKGTPKR